MALPTPDNLRELEKRHVIMTEREYLAFERASEIKHEYFDGVVVAMAGGTLAHAELCGRLYALVFMHLQMNRGKCRVFNSDARVRILSKKQNFNYVYPDLTVTCNPQDYAVGGGNDIIRSPRLVVEVLSPATLSTDIGKKLRWYQAEPTIEEYVIIYTEVQQVTVHRRSGDQWIVDHYFTGDSFVLNTVQFTYSVDELYYDLNIPSTSA